MAGFLKQLKNISRYSSEELSLRVIPNEVKTLIDQLDAKAKRLSEASEAVNEISKVSVIKTEKDVLKEKIDEHTAIINYHAPDHHTHDYTDDDNIDSIYNKLNDLFSTEGLILMDANMCKARQGLLLDEASKHDFGPKANFKRKKLKLGSFSGLPSYSRFLVERLKSQPLLTEFQPVELCNLEYARIRGSSIDPHIDDTWLWGEQLVTVNLLSRTILTLSPLQTETSMILRNGAVAAFDTTENILTRDRTSDYLEIQIPLSAKSLLILENEARHIWLHGIKTNHVPEKRYAMTFRNLSDIFCQNGEQYEMGMEVLKIANTFAGKVVI